MLLLAIAGTQILRLEIRMDRKMADDSRLAETSYMPPNQVLRFTSIGYEPFMADMVFISAQQYFFTHLTTDRQFNWLAVYTDAMVGYCRGADGERIEAPPSKCIGDDRGWVDGLFPFNPKIYTWATEIVKFVPRLTMGIVDKAINYGLTGIEFCPDSWEIYFELGFNLFHEHHGIAMEERELRSAQGLEYITLASKLPGAQVNPNFVAGHLWKRHDADGALETVYRTYFQSTPFERDQIRRRLEARGMPELAQSFASEEELWQENFRFVTHTFHHQLYRHANTTPQTQENDRDD